ncbi:MAG: hypothetical protein MUE61_22125 [Vicinamibacterales bacterium]|jgi:hypothetical protein|nr:hypothetical protein [Vicinamibacterales bacterium]
MAQTRGTFAELYDNIDKAVYTLLFDAQKELPKIWTKVFNVKSSDKKFERVMGVQGMGDIPEKAEGAAYTSDVIKAGWTKDFTHVEYGMMFEVTQTALEDDQYDQLSQHARWLMFSGRVTEEKKAHAVFNNGFSSELAPDGAALFSSSHTLKSGASARNTLATAADLSVTSLQQALIDLQTETKVEGGQLVAPAQDLVLFIPPALEFTADRILNSTLLPGSADNDRNPIKARRNWTIVVSPYLTDEDAWFLLDANKKSHGITSYTRVPMSMEPAMTDARTRNRMYPIRWRRSFGASFWQGAFGSPGV